MRCLGEKGLGQMREVHEKLAMRGWDEDLVHALIIVINVIVLQKNPFAPRLLTFLIRLQGHRYRVGERLGWEGRRLDDVGK